MLLMLVYAYDLLLPLLAVLLAAQGVAVAVVYILLLHTYYDPPKKVVPVDSGINNPCGLVAIVDFAP